MGEKREHALLRAVTSPLDETCIFWRVQWLQTLLREIAEGKFERVGDDEDPEATAKMIAEVRAMANDLCAALYLDRDAA